jgi:hypothetical protein
MDCFVARARIDYLCLLADEQVARVVQHQAALLLSGVLVGTNRMLARGP